MGWSSKRVKRKPNQAGVVNIRLTTSKNNIKMTREIAKRNVVTRRAIP